MFTIQGPGLCSSSRTGKTAPWAKKGHWGEHSLEVAPLWISRKASGCTTGVLLQHWGSFLGFHPFFPRFCSWVFPPPGSCPAPFREGDAVLPVEEAGADGSSSFLPSSGCIESSSWTPSWASRQVAGTQPCSSNVLTNHQPEEKTAGGSAKGSHQPKPPYLPPNHVPGGL